MGQSIRDVSLQKLLDDTSLIFYSSISHLPEETFLPNIITEPYIQTVRFVLYISALENNFSEEAYHQFSVFLSCLIKSTLYFHFCFDHPIQDPFSKLALMFGDLFLVQSGENLVKIRNFLRLHSSFRELLYSIALSQRKQETSKNLSAEDFEKIISMSYGNIFRFALISPYLWKKNKQFEKRNLTLLAKNISLFLAWNIPPFLDCPYNTVQRRENLLSKIKDNLGEELFNGYNFDGWKSNIQKTSGGNDPKNQSIKK